MIESDTIITDLRTEINTEDEMYNFFKRPGLIVMDVYSDAFGPCNAMVRHLSEMKYSTPHFEYLNLAFVKADDIPVLKSYRDKSKVTWLFVSGGKLVNIAYGCNAPQLTTLIKAELQLESKVMAGKYVRTELFELNDKVHPIERHIIQSEDDDEEEYDSDSNKTPIRRRQAFYCGL